MLLQGLELFWQLRIAHLIRIWVCDPDTHSVFHFAGAKIMQQRSPMFVFFQIFGDVL